MPAGDKTICPRPGPKVGPSQVTCCVDGNGVVTFWHTLLVGWGLSDEDYAARDAGADSSERLAGWRAPFLMTAVSQIKSCQVAPSR